MFRRASLIFSTSAAPDLKKVTEAIFTLPGNYY
jgi:hypothetical protein